MCVWYARQSSCEGRVYASRQLHQGYVSHLLCGRVRLGDTAKDQAPASLSRALDRPNPLLPHRRALRRLDPGLGHHGLCIPGGMGFVISNSSNRDQT